MKKFKSFFSGIIRLIRIFEFWTTDTNYSFLLLRFSIEFHLRNFSLLGSYHGWGICLLPSSYCICVVFLQFSSKSLFRNYRIIDVKYALFPLNTQKSTSSLSLMTRIHECWHSVSISVWVEKRLLA